MSYCRGAFIPNRKLQRRCGWYNFVIPAMCTLTCTKRSKPLAAGAIALEDAEANSEIVAIVEDCRSPSVSDVLVYHASICLDSEFLSCELQFQVSRCFFKFCFCFFCFDKSITRKRRLFCSSMVGKLLFSIRRFFCREFTEMRLGAICPIC